MEQLRHAFCIYISGLHISNLKLVVTEISVLKKIKIKLHSFIYRLTHAAIRPNRYVLYQWIGILIECLLMYYMHIEILHAGHCRKRLEESSANGALRGVVYF